PAALREKTFELRYGRNYRFQMKEPPVALGTDLEVKPLGSILSLAHQFEAIEALAKGEEFRQWLVPSGMALSEQGPDKLALQQRTGRTQPGCQRIIYVDEPSAGIQNGQTVGQPGIHRRQPRYRRIIRRGGLRTIQAAIRITFGFAHDCNAPWDDEPRNSPSPHSSFVGRGRQTAAHRFRNGINRIIGWIIRARGIGYKKRLRACFRIRFGLALLGGFGAGPPKGGTPNPYGAA